MKEFIPKSYLYFRSGYGWATFKKDLIAGVTVGVIALPLAMAFAIASGTSPERGLFTAIVAGFLISALGGSRIQIGGPTGAFVVLVCSIMQRTGYEGLAMSTCIAAILLVLFGLLRIGTWIKFIPHPLIIGFTTGIAVLIFSSQLKDFFGLGRGEGIHLPTLCLSSGTLAVIFAVRRFTPKLPWGIAAIVCGTLVSYLFDLPLETIQSKFGQIPNQLPLPSLPSFSIPEGKMGEICLDALAIAFLAGVESLLSAVIGDGMIGSRHKSNCELVAQGIANFASILFGGIPATGAIARTAANVKMGAQTPMAGMIHAATLFLIILFLAPVVSQIPLAALSAVLMMVAWNMAEMGAFLRLFRAPFGDVAILLTAFLFTVFFDLTIAISFGMILASFLFMKRMSESAKMVPFKPFPSGVEVYEMHGPFFFGAADLLKDVLGENAPKVLILKMHQVPIVDVSGMHALKEFYEKCRKRQIALFLAGVQDQTQKDLKKFGVTQQIGVFSSLEEALAKAEELF